MNCSSETESEKIVSATPHKLWHWRFVLFALCAACGFFLDVATKDWAFSEVYGVGLPGAREECWIIPQIFGIQTSLNQGALFGMAQGYVHFFALMALLAVVGVVAWFCYAAWRSLFLTLTLGVITAGILGNLYDRLGLHGLRVYENTLGEIHLISGGLQGEPLYAVRDWILVMIGSYHWPNFNLADSCLVCGALALMAYAFFWDSPTISPKPSASRQSANKFHGVVRVGLLWFLGWLSIFRVLRVKFALYRAAAVARSG